MNIQDLKEITKILKNRDTYTRIIYTNNPENLQLYWTNSSYAPVKILKILEPKNDIFYIETTLGKPKVHKTDIDEQIVIPWFEYIRYYTIKFLRSFK